MLRVLSADADTLEVQYSVESLQNLTPNAPFATINNTHHTSLINMAELYNIITKSMEQQSTNRNSGRRRERQYISVKPEQLSAPATHQYPTRQHQHQTPAPRVQTQKIKPGRYPRVVPIEVTMETQKKGNLADLQGWIQLK